MCVMGAQPPTNPSVSLAWDPSTDPDVTNYNLYYGLAHSNYTVGPIPMGNVTNFIATNLVYGWNTNYYFAATAQNSVGLESDFSNEVFWYATNGVSPPVLSISGESPN